MVKVRDSEDPNIVYTVYEDEAVALGAATNLVYTEKDMKLGIYTHYRKKLSYKVISAVKNCEGKEFIFYQQLYGKEKLYIAKAI